MIEAVKIPASRIAVLVGKGRSIKRTIEKKLNVKLTIEDEVLIEGDALDVMDAKNVVLAISRGFSPGNAFRLLEDDTVLSIIPLADNEKKIKRIKARIIGENGRARRNLEHLTNTSISVYGKTVSVIGKYDSIAAVTTAIDMFIKGYSHRAVYAFLEKNRSTRKSGQLI